MWGELEDKRLKPVIVLPSLLDRFFGRKKVKEVKVNEWQGRKDFEVPVDELQCLSGQCIEFLNIQMPEPWPATRYLIDYFNFATSVYMRGEQGKGDQSPKWYLQMGFSGCAGMAQISADLGFHWVDIWYKNNRRQIDREILLPYGFLPKEDQPVCKT